MHRAGLALALVGLAAYFASDAQAAMQPSDQADPNNGGLLDGLTDWVPAMLGSSPRGERNNNPGNIRLGGARWQGQVDGADKEFVTFDTPASGFRALAKLLKNYQALYNLRTVRGIINRYAPPSENNTAAYVDAVASALGVSPDAQIDLNNPGTLAALVQAITTHEQGRFAFNTSDLQAGVALA